MRPDGSWFGHAHAGILMCAEGVATYKCDGLGNMTEAGGVSFRGSAIFKTNLEALSKFSGKYYMFTHEYDAAGKSEWNLFPCK